jgi:hypothetical protein
MIRMLARLFFLATFCVAIYCFITNFSTPPQQIANEGSIEQIKEITPSYLYLVFIDPLFDPIEKDIIVRGLYDWQVKTNGIIQYYVVGSSQKLNVSPQDPIVFKSIAFSYAKPDTLIVMFIDALMGTDILGYCDIQNLSHSDSLTIFLVPDRIGSYKEYNAVVRHEYAHSLGLSHNKNRRTLMWPSAEDGAEGITQRDLFSFCQVYHCDEETMLGSLAESQWLMCYNHPSLKDADAGLK